MVAVVVAVLEVICFLQDTVMNTTQQRCENVNI